MLKCKVNRKKNFCMVKAGGELRYILTETLGIISTVYCELKKQNPEFAEEYKRTLQAAMIDPKSPVFTKEYFE